MRHRWHTRLHNKKRLPPGCMSHEHFGKLIEISTIHSEKVISALEDYCVKGSDRKSACGKFDVSPGYFSVCIRKLEALNAHIADIAPYYVNQNFLKLKY